MTAYDDLPDGVLIADHAGTVVTLNTAGSRLLSIAPAEALGRPYRDVLPLVDEHGRDWWACTDPYTGLRSRSRQPERLLTVSGGPAIGRDLLVTASYRRDADRRLRRLVVAVRGGVARERLERSRADLVSTVAHELRSPLTSIKGFTATLLAKWERFTDEQKQLMLRTVNADADRVTRLLTELLDVSRIDAGRLEMRKQVVDMGGAVTKAVAAQLAAGFPPDRFKVSVGPGLPETWLDPDKIDQIVGNLVENALRHGAGTVSLSVTGTGTGIELSVEDNGGGIDEPTAALMFTRFWRGDRRSGSGLGLYIVKGLVEAHDGTIEVGRAGSGGARLRILLPAGSPPYLS